LVVVAQKGGRVDLRAALKALGKRNVTSLLAEGGGELLGSLFDARLVDKVTFFYAPMIIGGRKAITAVAGEGVPNVNGAIRLEDCRWRRLGAGAMIVEARVPT
jgi:diaminohydroxyphosphoribosylaminopyrimidine deaminase/5-amino-6-(5-phosphoribosylamino)uracil reductase